MMVTTSLNHKTPLPLLPEVLLRGGLPRQAILMNLPWDELLDALAVDLSPFERLLNAELLTYVGNPILRQASVGGLGLKVLKAMAKKALKLASEPLMLTQDLSDVAASAVSPSLTLQHLQRFYASLGDSLHILTYTGVEQSLQFQSAEALISLIETAYACTPVEHIVIEVVSLPTDLLLVVSFAILKRCPNLRLTWRLQLQGFAPYHNDWIAAHRAGYTETINAWQQSVTSIFALRTLRETQKQSLGAAVRLGIEVETVCTPENESFLNQWYGFVLGVFCPDDWKLSLAPTPQPSEKADRLNGLLPYEATFVTLAQQWEADWLETGAWQALQPEERYKHATSWEQAHWVLAVRTLRNRLASKASSGIASQQPTGCAAGIAGGYLNTLGVLGGCEAFVRASSEATSTVGGYGAIQLAQFNGLSVWHSTQANLMRQLSGCASLCGNCNSSTQQLLPTQWLSVAHWYEVWGIQQGLMGNTKTKPQLDATLPEFVGHA